LDSATAYSRRGGALTFRQPPRSCAPGADASDHDRKTSRTVKITAQSLARWWAPFRWLASPPFAVPTPPWAAWLSQARVA